MKNVVKIQEVQPSFTDRRSFLKMSGLTLAGTGLLLAGCSKEEDLITATEESYDSFGRRGNLPGRRHGVFDFGGGDFGVLTYAYALEQLEADFYTKVVNANGFTSNFTGEEQQVLTDLYYHEVIHRKFFKKVLVNTLPNPSRQLLPNLEFEYEGVELALKLTHSIDS